MEYWVDDILTLLFKTSGWFASLDQTYCELSALMTSFPYQPHGLDVVPRRFLTDVLAGVIQVSFEQIRLRLNEITFYPVCSQDKANPRGF